MIEMLIYFFTVVLPGLAFLAAMAVHDEKVVPVGENFMPTTAEMKDFM